MGRPTSQTLAAAGLARWVAALAGLLVAVAPSRSVAQTGEAPASPRPDLGQQPKADPDASRRAGAVPTLEALIAALRAEEAKYRDIEYAVRITTRKVDPQAPEDPGEIQSHETRQVVLQGDRVWFRGESSSRVGKTDVRQEETSAYDGERTRSVIAGNSANVHLGRFEHPDVYPPHCVPLIHYHLNFPLSVYLEGHDAIHAHPKYGRFLREGGSVFEFARVEAHAEAIDQVDGLRCLKIRVNRWYTSDYSVLQYLWLALDRNYLCVKERLHTAPKSIDGGLVMHEMRVDALREIAPGVWFPTRVTVVSNDPQVLRQGKQLVSSRTGTLAWKTELGPRHDVAFFRDVEIPAGLPAFTIRDGRLMGSSLPEPVGDPATEQAKLQEVVARLHEQEKRYADLEVKARVDYNHLGVGLRPGLIVEQTRLLHSRLQEPLAYFTEQVVFTTPEGRRTEQSHVQAFDGQWTRELYRSAQDDQGERRIATLRKGGGGKTEGRHEGVAVLRPHTLLVRDDWLYGPLADLLVSPWHDKGNGYHLRFRYCGEEEFEGHPCAKLRGEITTRDGEPPGHYRALWLATDRNYVPIKIELYDGDPRLRPMPVEIGRCEEFRQIAPGLWYPFRTVQLSFDGWQKMIRGRLALQWRRVHEVESVTPSPRVDAALFHDVVVPAGTKVQVSDDAPKYLGEYDQDADGVAEITPARYQSFVSEAKARDEERKANRGPLDRP